MTKLDHNIEFSRIVVYALRADADLSTLMYQTRARVSPDDVRIYEAHAELPDGPEREVLPRVLVHTIGAPFDTEQAAADYLTPYGSVQTYIHVIVERPYRMLGEEVQAVIRDILVSTPLSDGSMIASVLVPDGSFEPVKEPSFKDAWRLSRQYRAQAGVL
jgi:hypothetical protein